MSHELRTPLNSIIGFTGIMLKEMSGEINEEQRKQLNLVKNSANHLLALINDVIDISKIEAGKVEIAIKEFDLSVLIQEIKDSFAVAVDKKGLELLLQTPQTFLIKSDERRTKQILVNFISNAIKFTDRGEIEIKVIQKNEMVEVSVRDTGIGIKKEDMGKLFETFSRITTKGRIEEGTGLGLYLSQKIAQLLGGDITAKSEFGKGSVFTLTLPLKR
jgi:signal transduction histidine kinase